MEACAKDKTIEIRVLGSLRCHLEEVLTYMAEWRMEVGECRSYDVAREPGLPPEEVEEVFRNGHVQNIYDPVQTGECIAFLPYGTSGPYRTFLGIWREGRKARSSPTGDKKGRGVDDGHKAF
ncbi:MAG TPA: hypothetical protein DDW42_09410 [Desulfobacteraceae bacterium]|nr:hypothetical protein [Desulfobacteraceae bacterium]